MPQYLLENTKAYIIAQGLKWDASGIGWHISYLVQIRAFPCQFYHFDLLPGRNLYVSRVNILETILFSQNHISAMIHHFLYLTYRESNKTWILESYFFVYKKYQMKHLYAWRDIPMALCFDFGRHESFIKRGWWQTFNCGKGILPPQFMNQIYVLSNSKHPFQSTHNIYVFYNIKKIAVRI